MTAKERTKKAAAKGSGLRPGERTPTEPGPREKTKSVLRQMATEKATPKKKKGTGPGPGGRKYSDPAKGAAMTSARMKKSMTDQGNSIEAQIRESDLSPAAKKKLIKQLRAPY